MNKYKEEKKDGKENEEAIMESKSGVKWERVVVVPGGKEGAVAGTENDAFEDQRAREGHRSRNPWLLASSISSKESDFRDAKSEMGKQRLNSE